jgi:lambda repressor-like predicted transcriptional regulator
VPVHRFAAAGHTLGSVDQADRDQAVAALRAEGHKLRAIAKQLGMSLAGVQRALARAEKAPAGDSELTSADLAVLDLTPADLATVLDPLQRYRTGRAPAVYGKRGQEALDKLICHPAWTDSGVVAVRPVPEFPGDRTATRDRRISELRRQGWTLAAIADRVGMSEGGVSRALQRLSGQSNTSEDWRADRSEDWE